jgi:hypothetical protein
VFTGQGTQGQYRQAEGRGGKQALGVAAALEVPALILIGRLAPARFSYLDVLATGCLAGIAYYLGLTLVTEHRADRAAIVERLVLRRHRAAAVPANDPPTGFCPPACT